MQINFDTIEKICNAIHINGDLGVDEYDGELQGGLDVSYDTTLGYPTIYNGVSKAVVRFENLPFVVKIPLDGMYFYTEEYDEETGEYISCEEPRIEYFSYAGCESGSDNGGDYCLEELARYRAMEKAGFGALVPEMEEITSIDFRSIYAQEKVIPYDTVWGGEDNPSTISENSRTKAANMNSDYAYCSLEWRAAVIEYYGEGYWESFVDWNERGNYGILDDMHDGNYGYRLDGSPVLLDVAGFRD